MVAQKSALVHAARGSEGTPGPSLLPGEAPGQASVDKTSEAMEVQLALLRSRYTEGHPEVARLRTAVENLKRSEGQKQAASAATASMGMASLAFMTLLG